MVLVTNNCDNQQKMTGMKKKLLRSTTLGILFLIIPILIVFVDPILLVVDYRLRLDNGTLLHDLLLTELKGPKLSVYLFNITNAEEFQSGVDQKLKLKEIGPFVYQEYRTHHHLEINREPGIMRYTPKLRIEFIQEESYGSPKDIYLTLPNIPLLSATALMSKYPYFIRQIFNMIAAGLHSKAFMNISVHDYFWGYPDPLISLANKAVPGLIYFKSIGLLERFYDFDVEYHMELGTTNLDKFNVKSVKRFKLQDKDSYESAEKTLYYNNSYEGAAFPPSMTPDMKIDIYRHSICKTFELQHVGVRSMYYGGEAFVYKFRNMSFNDRQLCDSKGWCPDGLINLAPCYFGLPFAMSRGNFLDSDPRLLERVEGLSPDGKIHDSEIIIDPKIGVTISGSVSLQVNLFLADVAHNTETKFFKDTIALPLSQVLIKQPKMLKEVKNALELVYTRGPAILLASQIICLVLSFGLILYSAMFMYLTCAARKGVVLDTNSKIINKAQTPLLFNDIITSPIN